VVVVVVVVRVLLVGLNPLVVAVVLEPQITFREIALFTQLVAAAVPVTRAHLQAEILVYRECPVSAVLLVQVVVAEHAILDVTRQGPMVQRLDLAGVVAQQMAVLVAQVDLAWQYLVAL
jgi:hypothetical protein